VARMIARVAADRLEGTVPRGAMAATGGEVTARVRTLVYPTNARRLLAVGIAAIALVPTLLASVAAARTNALFQRAEAAVVSSAAPAPPTRPAR
jgi:hypothetical protein